LESYDVNTWREVDVVSLFVCLVTAYTFWTLFRVSNVSCGLSCHLPTASISESKRQGTYAVWKVFIMNTELSDFTLVSMVNCFLLIYKCIVRFCGSLISVAVKSLAWYYFCLATVDSATWT